MTGEIEEIDWNLVSCVKASERRTQVLKALSEQPRMNGELAEEFGLSTPWVREQVIRIRFRLPQG